MSYSPITGTGTASAPVVNLTFPLLSNDHLKATVDGAPVAFIWSGPSQITFSGPVAVGQSWVVFRETPVDPLLVFADTTVLSAKDLNLLQTQLLYRHQELDNRVNSVADAVVAAEQSVVAAQQAAEAAAAAEAASAEAAATVADKVSATALSAPTGASTVGAPGGGTVEERIFLKGRAAPVAGSKAAIKWLRDDAAAPLENIGGLWSTKVVIDHGLQHAFTGTEGDTDANAPATTLFVTAKNADSPADVVAVMGFTEVANNGGCGFGANFAVFSSSGATNYKMQGMEIDLQPQAGSTWVEGGGIVLNVFTQQSPGPAIYFEGLGGGKWSTGVQAGNLSDIGAGLSPAPGNPRMGTLIDTGVAQYQIAPIAFSNTHKLLFKAASGNNAFVNVDAGNFMHLAMPDNGLAIRTPGDAATAVYIDTGGNIELQHGGTVKFTSAVSSLSAAAGAAVLPSNPVGFLTVTINGVNRKLPYYAS